RIERRDGRIQLVAPGVVTLLGNDRLREERLAAFEVVARHVTAAARRGNRRLGAVLREQQNAVVEARDDLAHLDARRHIDQTFYDLAGDAEADRALDARAHDPGIGQCSAAPNFANHHNLYRPHDLLLDFGLTGATAECRNQRDWQEQPQPTRAC